MKLKADIVNGDLCPDAEGIAQFLSSREFAAEVQRRVLTPHLRSPKPGPAEFYLQACDLAVSADEAIGVEARLSGVSGPTIATRRSIEDYPNALAALVELYRDTIERLLTTGFRCQIFVALMTDTPVKFKGEPTTLLESDPDWIEGKKGAP